MGSHQHGSATGPTMIDGYSLSCQFHLIENVGLLRETKNKTCWLCQRPVKRRWHTRVHRLEQRFAVIDMQLLICNAEWQNAPFNHIRAYTPSGSFLLERVVSRQPPRLRGSGQLISRGQLKRQIRALIRPSTGFQEEYFQQTPACRRSARARAGGWA